MGFRGGGKDLRQLTEEVAPKTTAVRTDVSVFFALPPPIFPPNPALFLFEDALHADPVRPGSPGRRALRLQRLRRAV